MNPTGVVSAMPEEVVDGLVHKTIIYIVEDPDCTIRVEEEEDSDDDDDDDDDDEEGAEKENDKEASEHSKDETGGEPDTDERKKFVTDFKINREQLASVSPFFKTFLTSKDFKDTGADIIPVHDVSSSVMNVILCAAHGMFSDADEEDPNYGTTSLFMQCVGQPKTATAIHESMRLPANQIIAVVAKAKEYLIDYDMIRDWLLLWNHNTSEHAFDVSVCAAAYHLDMAELFSQWTAFAIKEAYTERTITTVSTDNEDLEIPEKIRENMTKLRWDVLNSKFSPVMNQIKKAQGSQYYRDAISDIFELKPEGTFEIQSISQVLQLADRLAEHVKNEELDKIMKDPNESETRKLEAELRKAVLSYEDSPNSLCLDCIKRSLTQGHDRNSKLWKEDYNKKWPEMCSRRHSFSTWENSWAGEDSDRNEFVGLQKATQLDSWLEVGPRPRITATPFPYPPTHNTGPQPPAAYSAVSHAMRHMMGHRDAASARPSFEAWLAQPAREPGVPRPRPSAADRRNGWIQRARRTQPVAHSSDAPRTQGQGQQSESRP